MSVSYIAKCESLQESCLFMWEKVSFLQFFKKFRELLQDLVEYLD